jgi:glycosyltransferase involved in cell wall biosynthesis
MLYLAVILSGLIGIIALIQLVSTIRYVRWYVHHSDSPAEDHEFPKAAIILSLRGADPFLGECLDRLTTQDYPDYEVHVVLDHATDPARAIVEQWLDAHPDRKINVSFLRDISAEAYLKTNAVRQCIQELDASIGVVVLADADTMAYRRWLRDIVAPMIASDVGLVTGNRWYDPTARGWGSLVRYVYNGFCVVPMFFMRATWGGSVAIRRDVFDQSFFLDRMRRTPSEDPAVQEAAHHAGLRLEVHPNVMMLNREASGLRSCFGFLSRQLLWTRLYHSKWSAVLIGALVAYLVLAGGTVAVVLAAAAGESTAAILLGGTILAELLLSQCILEWLHATVSRRAGRAQGEAFPRINWLTRLRLMAALPMTLIFFTFAAVAASLARRVCWRGITYQIVAPDGIRMVEYQPYAEVARRSDQRRSLS